MADDELFARFCQEAKAVQMLTHPNIIAVHEFGVTLGGQPFMAMDYIEGQTLADVLEKRGRIGVKRLLRIFIQVCDALGHAHQHNIIHRDIKPGNIMLLDTANDTDVVKVFDFGFAKFLERPGKRVQALTQIGDVLGTPLYMSPEQSAGKKLDSRSDIYSVGCVMYEALTGKAPLIGENVLDTMHKQINDKPLPLDAARPDLFIPEPLTQILFKTLEKDPDKRYQSMSDLKRDLEIVAMSMSGRATKITELPGLAKLKELPEEGKRLPPGLIATIAVLVLATFTVVGLTMLFTPKPETTLDDIPKASKYPAPPAVPKTPIQSKPVVTGPLPNDPQKLQELARYWIQQGALGDAERASIKAIAVLKERRHTNDLAAAQAFGTAGEVYLASENYKKADQMLKKALAIKQRELGAANPEVISIINSLARAAEGQGDYARADAYYKQALALQSAR